MEMNEECTKNARYYAPNKVSCFSRISGEIFCSEMNFVSVTLRNKISSILFLRIHDQESALLFRQHVLYVQNANCTPQWGS
mmetsp:Transcript_16500/g.23123  ORF Transcript_16500/g.23123 Transcript_16500/m.23123 type:complete len:81 (+) Transcript_16500:45-287(+)